MRAFRGLIVALTFAHSVQAARVKTTCKNGKSKVDFRNYDNEENERKDIVFNHYFQMREGQTVEFVRRMEEKYSFEHPRAVMSVREAFVLLEHYVDSSDPDMSLPNLIHMLQTAEGIRKAGKPDWMQLVGLIHDMGKIMFLWGTAEDGQRGTAEGPQWALGGDTWVVGAPLPDSMIYPELNMLNPDAWDLRYNSTSTGMYPPAVGLDNVHFAWGHDEYLYRMLLANNCPFPADGLAMIRYHSCYPWHSGGAYRDLMQPADYDALRAVTDFNKFDLYTKDETDPIKPEELWPYYQTLIDKYMPGQLVW